MLPATHATSSAPLQRWLIRPSWNFWRSSAVRALPAADAASLASCSDLPALMAASKADFQHFECSLLMKAGHSFHVGLGASPCNGSAELVVGCFVFPSCLLAAFFSGLALLFFLVFLPRFFSFGFLFFSWTFRSLNLFGFTLDLFSAINWARESGSMPKTVTVCVVVG